MKEAEGMAFQVLNGNEENWIDLNNSRFGHMHNQWFGPDDDPDPDPDPKPDPDPDPAPDPDPKPDLAGFMAGATAEQKEKYADYFKDMKKLPELIDKHMELVDKAGKAIEKPGDDATDEEVAAYREAAGIPKTAEEYDLGELPEGTEKDPELDKWFRATALKSDLSVAQAKTVFSDWNTMVAAEIKIINQEKEDAKKACDVELRKEYGKDYDVNMAMSKRILNIGGPELWQHMNETGIGSDPRFVRAIVAVAQMISEDSLMKLTSDTKGTEKTAAEVLYGED